MKKAIEISSKSKHAPKKSTTGKERNAVNDSSRQKDTKRSKNVHPPVVVLNVAKPLLSDGKGSRKEGEDEHPPSQGTLGKKSQGNIHPPKLIQRVLEKKKETPRTDEALSDESDDALLITNHQRPKLVLNMAESIPEPSSEPSEATEPPLLGNATSSDPHERWAFQQSSFVRTAERMRKSGPRFPMHTSTDVDWNDVYGRSPRTVVMLNRAKNENLQKVLERRRSIVSKVKSSGPSPSNKI